MEQLILEIEAYVADRDITPQKFLRDVISAPWGQWQRWKDGLSSPTMRIADKLRAHMAENPVSEPVSGCPQREPQPAASAAQPPEGTA